jgi:hypothetical protein
MWSRVPRDWETRMAVLATASSNLSRLMNNFSEKHFLSSKYVKVLEIKNMVMGSNGARYDG